MELEGDADLAMSAVEHEDGFTLMERKKKKVGHTRNKSNACSGSILRNQKEGEKCETGDTTKGKGQGWGMGLQSTYTSKVNLKNVVDSRREWTVLIGSEDIIGFKVMTLPREIETVIGHGASLALWQRHDKNYKATLDSEEPCVKLVGGLKYKGQTMEVKRLHRTEFLVSFLHLPPDVTDEVILGHLARWGVIPVLPVRRRYYPGTRVTDGTRFLKVRFPKDIVALPYSARFDTADGPQYCRLIHDNQVKTCRFCMSPGHLFRDCPDRVPGMSSTRTLCPGL